VRLGFFLSEAFGSMRRNWVMAMAAVITVFISTAILGAVLLKAGEAAQMAAGDLPALAAGFGSAAITGFLALKLLFAVIQRTGLGVFAYYCWAVGIAALIARGMQA